MTEDTSKKNYSYLEQMSTEDLKSILSAAALSEEADDPALVDYALEVIMRREQNDLPDVERARKDFDKFYRNLESPLYPIAYDEEVDAVESPQLYTNVSQRKKRRVKQALVAAAVIAALISLTCIPVLGYANVVQMVIAYWTDDYFTYGENGKEAESIIDGKANEIPNEFLDLYDVLTQKGVEVIAIPRYIPEDLEIDDSVLYVSPRSGEVEFYIQYRTEKDYLLFNIIQRNPSDKFIYEKDNVVVEEYIPKDIKYSIFSNNDIHTIAWYVEGLEYTINSSLSISSLKEIIDSIHS